MAFENITKGNFKSNGNAVHCDFKCVHIGTDELRHENAEFIAFCFNFQQRYDISKLEDAVELLDKIYSNGGVGIGVLKQIEQLLKQIKK